MKFYSSDNKEVELQDFERGSIVIARVTKPMTEQEWDTFCSGNGSLCKEFQKQGLHLVFCPDWVEFKEWK